MFCRHWDVDMFLMKTKLVLCCYELTDAEHQEPNKCQLASDGTVERVRSIHQYPSDLHRLLPIQLNTNRLALLSTRYLVSAIRGNSISEATSRLSRTISLVGTRCTTTLILLRLTTSATSKLSSTESMVGIWSRSASAVSSITIICAVDRSRVLSGVEAELGIYSALDAFGVVGTDSAGLFGLPAGFAGVAGVAAVTLLLVWICNAGNVGDIAVKDIAFDH